MHYIGLPGIGPGLHAPHACVLPVYYSPLFFYLTLFRINKKARDVNNAEGQRRIGDHLPVMVVAANYHHP